MLDIKVKNRILEKESIKAWFVERGLDYETDPTYLVVQAELEVLDPDVANLSTYQTNELLGIN